MGFLDIIASTSGFFKIFPIVALTPIHLQSTRNNSPSSPCKYVVFDVKNAILHSRLEISSFVSIFNGNLVSDWRHTLSACHDKTSVPFCWMLIAVWRHESTRPTSMECFSWLYYYSSASEFHFCILKVKVSSATPMWLQTFGMVCSCLKDKHTIAIPPFVQLSCYSSHAQRVCFRTTCKCHLFVYIIKSHWFRDNASRRMHHDPNTRRKILEFSWKVDSGVDSTRS